MRHLTVHWKWLEQINRTMTIEDILSWKNESTDGELSDDELRKYRTCLKKHSDAKLAEHWQETVGEWLASRGDIEDVREQFLRLQMGAQNYGYVI